MWAQRKGLAAACTRAWYVEHVHRAGPPSTGTFTWCISKHLSLLVKHHAPMVGANAVTHDEYAIGMRGKALLDS
jgi:hypothetical protein